MKHFFQVSCVVFILLSVFYTYFSLMEAPEGIKVLMPLYFMGLAVYYVSRWCAKTFDWLRKYPIIQLTLLYLFGVIMGIGMTAVSYGFNGQSLVLALKINLFALPLFLLIVLYWRRETKKLNAELKSFQLKLKQEMDGGA